MTSPSTWPSGRQVKVARVYDEPANEDGTRVLVDRIWPRGMTKARAHLDEWCRQVAPSTELRTWYAHDRTRFDEFRRRYLTELDEPERAAAISHLRDLAQHGELTLLTATRDADISAAQVLVDLLRG